MSGCVAAILWQTNSQSDAANLPDATGDAERRSSTGNGQVGMGKGGQAAVRSSSAETNQEPKAAAKYSRIQN